MVVDVTIICVHTKYCHFSLSSITCSGSMGIISARYLEHPVRQCKGSLNSMTIAIAKINF